MLTLTATDFFSNPGRRNQEVQTQPIEVRSHGRTIGYYLSPTEYSRLAAAAHRASEPGAYNSIKGLVHTKRNDILAIIKRYGVSRIRLFGSVARGEDRPQSDIDFLVDYPPDHVYTSKDLGLAGELEELFEGRRVDLTNASRADLSIKPYILAEAIEI